MLLINHSLNVLMVSCCNFIFMRIDFDFWSWWWKYFPLYCMYSERWNQTWRKWLSFIWMSCGGKFLWWGFIYDLYFAPFDWFVFDCVGANQELLEDITARTEALVASKHLDIRTRRSLLDFSFSARARERNQRRQKVEAKQCGKWQRWPGERFDLSHLNATWLDQRVPTH